MTRTRHKKSPLHCAHFPTERIMKTGPSSASEDFGSFGAAWHAPSVFWFVGSTDAATYIKAEVENRLNEIPTSHNPRFAPVLHPTLETGVAAMIVAALAWLSSEKDFSQSNEA
jgi:hippurate hydrolase